MSLLTCYNEDQVHRDTNTDNGDRVYQACAEEEGYLQFGSQFGLTCRAFNHLSAQQAYTDSGTITTLTLQDGGSMLDLLL